jgi:hypothetical protein
MRCMQNSHKLDWIARNASCVRTRDRIILSAFLGCLTMKWPALGTGIYLYARLIPPVLFRLDFQQEDTSLHFLKLVAHLRIWSFRDGNYEEFHFLWYKIPVRTSQETHYVSATEPSRLMLCKILDFHGGDHEEYRLLGYKTPVRTSHEIHYVYATEPSRLMLCKIWDFQGDDYEELTFSGL